MTAAILLVLGLIAATPAHSRLSRDAHPATHAAAPPVIYQFKAAIEGQLTYDNPFLEIYPKVGSSGYGCIPVTRATTTLSFTVRPSNRPGPNLTYGVGTNRFGLLGGMRVASSSASVRATNEFGQPGGRRECVPQPPGDCGGASRPARGLLIGAYISRAGFTIGLDGTRFQPGTPYRSCYIDRDKLVADGSETGPDVMRRVKDSRISVVVLQRTEVLESGEGGPTWTFRWRVTLTRVRKCSYKGPVLQEACRRGLR